MERLVQGVVRHRTGEAAVTVDSTTLVEAVESWMDVEAPIHAAEAAVDERGLSLRRVVVSASSGQLRKCSNLLGVMTDNCHRQGP